MNNVFAVLVSFNPEKNELKNAIKKLLLQVDKVIVCNNSTNGFNCCSELNSLADENVKFFDFNENLGIAKAQSIGMEWAFKNDADYILQMDQDSMPNDNMVVELLSCYKNLTEEGLNIGLVGSQDYDKYTGEINYARLHKGTALKNNPDYYVVDSTLSSGSLIPKDAYYKIGGMRDELFIDAVDHEYCWRLRHAGYIVVRNKKALLGHRLGDGKYKILNSISVGLPSPFRHYYATRNIFLLLKEKHVPIFWKFSSLIKLSGKLVFYPIFLPNGMKRLKFLCLGIYDGILGRSGIMK